MLLTGSGPETLPPVLLTGSGPEPLPLVLLTGNGPETLPVDKFEFDLEALTTGPERPRTGRVAACCGRERPNSGRLPLSLARVSGTPVGFDVDTGAAAAGLIPTDGFTGAADFSGSGAFTTGVAGSVAADPITPETDAVGSGFDAGAGSVFVGTPNLRGLVSGFEDFRPRTGSPPTGIGPDPTGRFERVGNPENAGLPGFDGETSTFGERGLPRVGRLGADAPFSDVGAEGGTCSWDPESPAFDVDPSESSLVAAANTSSTRASTSRSIGIVILRSEEAFLLDGFEAEADPFPGFWSSLATIAGYPKNVRVASPLPRLFAVICRRGGFNLSDFAQTRMLSADIPRCPSLVTNSDRACARKQRTPSRPSDGWLYAHVWRLHASDDRVTAKYVALFGTGRSSAVFPRDRSNRLHRLAAEAAHSTHSPMEWLTNPPTIVGSSAKVINGWPNLPT